MKILISRREFTAGCAACLSLPGALALGADQPSPTVKFPDGVSVSALGQGTWHLGQGRHPPAEEQEAVRTGISLGMTLIDTSGNYGSGKSESFLGRALAGQRERIFLVTKVEADEVEGDGIARACQGSLKRLATDHLDLYLLHAPVPSSQLPHVVAEFEKLRAAGKIRAWGVSNFDKALMEDLWRVPDGKRCVTNQVAYSLKFRDIERDLLPWCEERNMPVMAYSPLGGEGNHLVSDKTLAQVGAAHGVSASAVALAWLIRHGKIIAIPESGAPAHAKENAAALAVSLTPQDLKTINDAYPGPRGAA